MTARHLIQILLPLYDNNGVKFPQAHYTSVKQTLIDKFGGVTVYMRAPAEGLWESASDDVQKDHIAIFEVMAESLDSQWWKKYRQSLEKEFVQEKIIIRAQEIDLLEDA